MKNRPRDKKAGVILLAALIIISLAEIIFRATVIGEAVLTTSNLGEQLAVIALAVTILIFTAKGKHRICYICYGAWLACFVLNQVFGLPSMLVDLTVNTTLPGIIAVVIRIICMVNIIAMGALIVEYMNDGTIYNRAFNALSIITILLFAADIFKCIYIIASGAMPAGFSADVELAVFKKQMMLVVFNDIYHIIMTFMFAFFAYDSAKMQLKKTKLS